MDPELFQKVLEHNRESARLKTKFSKVGLIIGPGFSFLGIRMYFHPIHFTWPWNAVLSDPLFGYLSFLFLLGGGYCFFVSFKWLLQNRTNHRA